MPGPFDTSIYQQKPAEQPNMLGAVVQFAQAQNALNQSRQFEQVYKARQALGPMFQSSLDPNGNVDFAKFSRQVATHPDTGWMLPELTKQFIDNQLVKENVARVSLENAKTKMDVMNQTLGGLVIRAVKAANGDPNQAVLKPGDVIEAIASIDPKIMSKEEQYNAITHMMQTVNPQGLPDEKLSYPAERKIYEMIQQTAQATPQAAENISRALAQVQQDYGGGVARFATGVAGGQRVGYVLPKTMTPGEYYTPQQVGSGAAGESIYGSRGEVTGAPPPGAIPPTPTGIPANPLGAGSPAQTAGPNTGGVAPVQGPGPQPAATGPVHTFQVGQSPMMADLQKNFGQYQQKVTEAGQRAVTMKMVNEDLKNLMRHIGPDGKPVGTMTGGGTTSFVAAAKLAQGIGHALGIDDKTLNPWIDAIAHGDVGASESFMKMTLQNSVANLRQTLLAEGGQPRVKEFEEFLARNPNIDTDPRAILHMLRYGEHVANITLREQREMNNMLSIYSQGQRNEDGSYKHEPGTLPNGMTAPWQWPAHWNNELMRKGIWRPPADFAE